MVKAQAACIQERTPAPRDVRGIRETFVIVKSNSDDVAIPSSYGDYNNFACGDEKDDDGGKAQDY